MDILNLNFLTYKELENLEKAIVKRKTELECSQYKSLINGVLNAINAIIEAGYGDMIALYGDYFPLDWKDLSHRISNEHEKGED